MWQQLRLPAGAASADGRACAQTYISVKELVPTALKYDPHNKVTSTSIIAGMVLMSASLLLFTI